ncbi:MAG: ParB/RepB/Spo0J family partition protein [Oscillospiraceae bacterium]|nr:ParB/RepB/Spo0J family partition protein [Oscillospiraceae bacterium]
MPIGLLQRRNNSEINKVVLLPVEEVATNPSQPRKYFDQDGINELSQSILTNGLLQPISVRKLDGGGYQLVAGERRLRAFKYLGHEKIPAIVENYTDEQSATLALIENLQRRDLHYFEEAAGIEQLMITLNMTQQQISQKLGKAQSTVANKLRLLKYSDETQAKMIAGNLTERHARALLSLPEPDDTQAIDYIIQNNLNVEQTEKYVQRLWDEKNRPKTVRTVIIKDMRIFLNSINKAVKLMQSAGIDVSSQKKEMDNHIELVVKIPKESVYRKVLPPDVQKTV